MSKTVKLHKTRVVTSHTVEDSCTCDQDNVEMQGGRSYELEVCLDKTKLPAKDGKNLTFFLVPLMNSLYISDRR